MKRIIGLLIISAIITLNIYAEKPLDEKVNFLPEEDRAEYLFNRGIGFYNLNKYSKCVYPNCDERSGDLGYCREHYKIVIRKGNYSHMQVGNMVIEESPWYDP